MQHVRQNVNNFLEVKIFVRSMVKCGKDSSLVAREINEKCLFHSTSLEESVVNNARRSY